MPPEPSAPAKPGSPRPAKLRHLLAGPLVFAVLLLIPLGGLAFETRGAMGLLVWMAWWWITRPVHLAVTGLLPLPIAAVFLLPSSAGGPAVAAGYGVNLQTMAVKGLFASLLVLLTLVVLGYALARWWPAFGVA